MPDRRDFWSCPAEHETPASYITISGSRFFLVSRTPAWWRSKTIRPVFSVARHWNCWPKLQKTKSGHPEDVRFSMPVSQRRDFPERSYERFWGRGGELDFSRRERPKAARRAVPVATEEATGIDSNAKASPRPSLSPLPTVPPAPRRGREHPDGWPRNWRARSRRRTGRCAAV